MLTGVDVDGIQTAEFGSSEGVIEEQIAWGKAGTPKRGDELILFEVTFCAGKGQDREAVTRAHALCDEFVQQYRECLKKLRGEQCTERREFYDIERPGRKKVGAMLGDQVEVGCGSVLNPGTVIGRESNIYPLSSVRGCVSEKSIYKRLGEVAEKRKSGKTALPGLSFLFRSENPVACIAQTRADVGIFIETAV